MLSETEKDAIKQRMMLLWFTWMAMVGSLLIYIYIVHVFGDEIRKPMHPDFPMEHLCNILYGITIVVILLSHFLRKFTLTARNGNAFRGLLKYGAQSNQPLFVGKYTVALMISLVLSESIAIYGLVLFLLGADYQTFYIFTAISALSMFFYRPKKTELEKLAVAMQPK